MRFFGSPASRLFRDARKALDAGDTDRAIGLYEELTTLAEGDSHAWFNLGLAYKFKADWPNSARCNRRAAELDSSNKEAFWNLGVASTAERDWPTARWAWRNIDMDPGVGDGPAEMTLGPSPIRLNPGGNGEVVWGDRIDPCRARIVNVPLPDSGHRWGDVVLHDVVPRGERESWGKTWGVFDELIRMDPGVFLTLESEVTAPTEADKTALEAVFEREDLGVEDWTSNVRWICQQCSLSSPHEHTTLHEVSPIWVTTRRYGFAGPESRLLELLRGWANAGDGRAFGPLREAREAS